MQALRDRAERAEAALIDCIEERDLAIAHDRQPYPTADAYERVCATLQRAEALLAEMVTAYTRAGHLTAEQWQRVREALG